MSDLSSNVQPIDKAGDVLQLKEEKLLKLVRETIKAGKHDFELPTEFKASSIERTWLVTGAATLGVLLFAAFLVWFGYYLMVLIVVAVGGMFVHGRYKAGARAAAAQLSVRLDAERVVVLSDGKATFDAAWSDVFAARLGWYSLNDVPAMTDIVLVTESEQIAVLEFEAFPEEEALKGTLLRKLLDHKKINLAG